MSKSIVSFIGENEKSEKIEKLLSQPIIIGDPEDAGTGKRPEDREYLLLYYASDEEGEEDVKSFEFITGRIPLFNFIKNIIESLDIHKSEVLVETKTLEGRISVYEFMRHVSSLVETTDSFDIEDYNHGDVDDK